MTAQLRDALMQALSQSAQPNQEKPRKPALLADVRPGKMLDASSDDGALDEIDIQPDKYDTIDLSDPQVDRAREINRILEGLRQGGYSIKQFGDPAKPAQYLIKQEDDSKTQEELDAGSEQTSDFGTGPGASTIVKGKAADLNNDVIEEALLRYFELTAPKKKTVTPDVIAEAK
jgi:hypothetical protein